MLLEDAPIISADDDWLDRREFARMVSDIALQMAGAPTVRIGIYGRWGEGKTSVLGLVAEQAARAGAVVVWFSPWPASSSADIRFRLVMQIADAVGLPASWTHYGPLFAKGLKYFRGIGGDLNNTAKRVDAVFGALVQDLADKAGYRAARTTLNLIRSATERRQVIVLIDDLDRVKPELLPDFLLLLRDGLEFPGLRFVLALDPEVVHMGLAQVHGGWKAEGSFLEKIVEYPFYLPAIPRTRLRQFVHAAVERASVVLSPDGLDAVVPLLAPHPRRVKSFLRLMASVNPSLKRYAPADARCGPLYVAQLLNFEFPRTIRRLLNSDEKLETLATLSYRYSPNEPEKEKPNLEALLTSLVVGDDDLQRLLQLFLALLAQTSLGDGFPVWRYLNLIEEPPLVTWRELQDLVDGASDAASADLPHVVDSWLANSDFRGIQLEPALFRKLVEAEVRGFEHAVEQHTAAEVAAGVESLHVCLSILDDLIIRRGVFESGIVGSAEWLLLYQSFQVYSAWATGPGYLTLRNAEVATLRRATDQLTDDDCVEVLEQLFMLRQLGDVRRDNTSGELHTFVNDFFLTGTLAYAEEAIRDFATVDGITRTDSDSFRRWLWFDPASPVHAKLRPLLTSILDTEKVAPQLSSNAYRYLGSLAYALTGRGLTRHEDAKEIFTRGDLGSRLWRVAISQPLNRRMLGSLIEYRDQLVGQGMDESGLLLPGWATRMLTLDAKGIPQGATTEGAEDLGP